VSERILCAAIWVDDGQEHPHQPTNTRTGVVVCGHRHHNCIIVAALAFPGQPIDRHQGFLTNTNRYVGREEAAVIAYAAAQTGRRTALFSEDLY
jgi:hypothetical protein